MTLSIRKVFANCLGTRVPSSIHLNSLTPINKLTVTCHLGRARTSMNRPRLRREQTVSDRLKLSTPQIRVASDTAALGLEVMRPSSTSEGFPVLAVAELSNPRSPSVAENYVLL